MGGGRHTICGAQEGAWYKLYPDKTTARPPNSGAQDIHTSAPATGYANGLRKIIVPMTLLRVRKCVDSCAEVARASTRIAADAPALLAVTIQPESFAMPLQSERIDPSNSK